MRVLYIFSAQIIFNGDSARLFLKTTIFIFTSSPLLPHVTISTTTTIYHCYYSFHKLPNYQLPRLHTTTAAATATTTIPRPPFHDHHCHYHYHTTTTTATVTATTAAATATTTVPPPPLPLSLLLYTADHHCHYHYHTTTTTVTAAATHCCYHLTTMPCLRYNYFYWRCVTFVDYFRPCSSKCTKENCVYEEERVVTLIVSKNECICGRCSPLSWGTTVICHL